MITVDAAAPRWAHDFAQGVEGEIQAQLSQPVRLPAFAVASLPSAARFNACMIFVADESGGAIPAFSDGTDWRRVTDRAVVS